MEIKELLSKLRDVNPSGKAPHQPLMMTVLEAAERDRELPEVLVVLPQLVCQSKLFEHIVAYRRKQNYDNRWTASVL